MGGSVGTPPSDITNKLKAIQRREKRDRNDWLNKEYFTTMESLASKAAISSIEGTDLGRHIGLVLYETMTSGNPDGLKKLKGIGPLKGFTEMISHKGLVVDALDALYGEKNFGGTEFDTEIIERREEIKKLPFFTKKGETYTRGRSTWKDIGNEHGWHVQVRTWAQGADEYLTLMDLPGRGLDPTEHQSQKEEILDAIASQIRHEQDVEDTYDLHKGTPPSDEDGFALRLKWTFIKEKLDRISWLDQTPLEMMGLTRDEVEERKAKKLGKTFGLSDELEPDTYFYDQVLHGRNKNVRIPNDIASNLFEMMRIPYVGGVSGTTVDFIGTIEQQKNIDPALEDHTACEKVIAAWIFGMVGAGHHSMVEMLCAANQWGYFLDIPNPFSELILGIKSNQENIEVTTYNECLKAFERKVNGMGIDTKGTLAWALDNADKDDVMTVPYIPNPDYEELMD